MENHNRIRGYGALLRRYIWILVVAWTVIIGVFLGRSVYLANKEVMDIAYFEAKMSIDKDILFRRWNAMQGGVYVTASEYTPPNPYLSHILERDIKLPSGKTLTLVNPAYMTRQVYELAQNEFDTLGHITSQRPVNPNNAPDPWEAKALEAFSQGKKKVSSINKMEGKEYMRLMYPFFIEQSCLKCHDIHGYKLGDLRGGISVSIPMAPIRAILQPRIAFTYIMHTLVWAIGLAAIVFAARKLNKSEAEREKIISKLQESISEVKVLSGLLPICASCKKIRDDKGYWNMLEVYIRDHSEAEFSHGLCPECMMKVYPDHYKKIEAFKKKDDG